MENAKVKWSFRQTWSLGMYVCKWLLLAGPTAAAVGSLCAFFLWALARVTDIRHAHGWLLFLLPFAGIGIVLLYRHVGESSEAGTDLLMDEIHQPGGGVPRRMAPLILLVTIITHLFGGSAGREGTAVQMGGSIAATFGRWFKVSRTDMPVLLMCGIAAGFGGVFGTPLTGAVFAMEVLVIGRISYEALLPCLIASVVSDWTCETWGIRHEPVNISPSLFANPAGVTPYDFSIVVKVAVAAVAFGLASVLFAELTHGLKHVWERIKEPLMRPVAGALCVIALVYLLGTRDYIGLGVISPDPHSVTILSCFLTNGAKPLSWFWKLLFTSVTLSCGFKGGEVTPLFYIGAALGHTLGHIMNAPVDLFAALGMVAVFAAATNTPLACTIMGIELFGSRYTVYFMIACFLSYGLSGHSGIYGSQRIGTPKVPWLDIPIEPLSNPAIPNITNVAPPILGHDT